MAKTCVTEKTAGRQRWIEQGLQELMLAKRFEEITVTDLCRHLGLSRRSFYRYFSDLEDVLDSLMHHTFQEFAIPNARPNLEELRANYEFWLDRSDLLEALARSGISGRLMEFTLRYTRAELPNDHLSPERRDWDQEARLFVIGGLVSMIIAWHAGGFQKTPEQMARIAYRMLTEPILEL